MNTCADCRVKDCVWFGDVGGVACGFLRVKRSRTIINVVVIAIFLTLLAAVVASAIGTAVNEGRQAWEPKTTMQIESTVLNRDIGYEPAVVAQYLADGTACIVSVGSPAVWVDRAGARHEVPTLYVSASGPHEWRWDGKRFVVSGDDK